MRRPDLARSLEIGDRVFLREPTRRDQEEIIARNRASRALHRGWVAPPTDAKAFIAWLERAQEPWTKHLLVCRLEDGAIVGVFTLNQIVRRLFQSAYLGYYAEQPFAGQGYMREGLQLVLRHVFTTMKLHRIEANVQPENVASLALVKRSGFRLEGFSPRYLKIAGRWRDHQRWAMLIDDWRRQLSLRYAQSAAPQQKLLQRAPSPGRARRARPASSSPGRRRSG